MKVNPANSLWTEEAGGYGIREPFRGPSMTTPDHGRALFLVVLSYKVVRRKLVGLADDVVKSFGVLNLGYMFDVPNLMSP